MANAKKKQASISLKGKKPCNTARRIKPVTNNPGKIANKMKRSEMYGKYLMQKRKSKQEARLKRIKECAALGEEEAAAKKQTPKTIDNTRELEPTVVLPTDEEVTLVDEADDEFAPYFSLQEEPKVMVTTRPRPSAGLFHFIADLQRLIPALHFYPRKSYSIKEICQFAANRKFTHLMVLSEKSKVCNGLTLSHLRPHDSTGMAGPTAFFKISNVVTSNNIPNHGASTSHVPELNLHNFSTHLGHRVGRLLASLFPHAADFRGRQVVTFHNQRDYIFVRHHRYIFKDKAEEEAKKKIVAKMSKARENFNNTNDTPMPGINTRLQELGPRFTLKMRWLQEGTFENVAGEYEWIHKRKEMDTTRRKFHL